MTAINIITRADNGIDLTLDIDLPSNRIMQILYGEGEIRQIAEDAMEAGWPWDIFAGSLNDYNYTIERA